MKPKIEALMKQIRSGKRMSDMARILNYVIKNPFCTTAEVEIKLGMKHQTASARISDLLDLGAIEERGSKVTAASKCTCLIHQPNRFKQLENAKKRKKVKFENWKNKGLKSFKDFLEPELIFQLECQNN